MVWKIKMCFDGVMMLCLEECYGKDKFLDLFVFFFIFVVDIVCDKGMNVENDGWLNLKYFYLYVYFKFFFLKFFCYLMFIFRC